jgi:hypothetical protein
MLKNMLICLYILTIIQNTSCILLYNLLIIYYLTVHKIDSQSQLLQSIFFYTLILAGML